MTAARIATLPRGRPEENAEISAFTLRHGQRKVGKFADVPTQAEAASPLNLKRRHLDESQRGLVAARIATLGHGQRQIGQLADLPTQDEAADLLNVGERTVRRAREVLTSGVPELVAAVEHGTASVSAAAEVANAETANLADLRRS